MSKATDLMEKRPRAIARRCAKTTKEATPPSVSSVVRGCRNGRKRRRTNASARFRMSLRSENRRRTTGKTRRPIDSFATELVSRRKLPKTATKRPAANPPRRRPLAFKPKRYAGGTARHVSNGTNSCTCVRGDNPPTEEAAAHRREKLGSFSL